MSDILSIIESTFGDPRAEVAMKEALIAAFLRDPLRAIEAVARLKSIGLLGSSPEEMGDAELLKIARAAVSAADKK